MAQGSVRERAEKRHEEMQGFDRQYWKNGKENIAGVDEAGRGPLAGPVCAAAVILPPNADLVGINDSKKISEKKREELFEKIISQAVAYSIQWASPERIDEVNILNATMETMSHAVSGLSVQPDYVLIDGNRLPELSCPGETVVKGDAKSLAVAAASILAKVSRDRLMCALAEEYPEYGFDKHKGYGTAEHITALKAVGPSPIHRNSFLNKILGEYHD